MKKPPVASARQVFLGSRPAPPDEQAVLERSFFKSISLANGTHKTTAPARLSDVDRMIGEQFERGTAVRLLDVGISSGVTTLELLDQLERRGVRVSGVGVDICVRAYLWSFLGVDVLYDSKGNVLQVATPFFARGRPHRSQKSIQSRLLGRGMDFLQSSCVRRLAKPEKSRPLALVSQRLLCRGDFAVVEHDVALSEPAWAGSFDLIRAANVLNLDYFSPPQLTTMLKNLTSWLKGGGLLAVCRTSGDDGSNHGSFYRRRDDSPRLRLESRLGRGSELDPLIAEALWGE
jgi:hypothetical protein